MAWLLRSFTAAVLALALAGCLAGPQPEPPTNRHRDAGGIALPDASPGGGADGGIGPAMDAATDAGPAPAEDAGTVDAAPMDAAMDAAPMDGDLPDADLPDADLPDADVPDADIPDADLPDADVPDAVIPDAHLDDATPLGSDV